MVNSYNTINAALYQFAANHLSLKRYNMSFFEQFDNFSTSGNSFPILYAVPVQVSFEKEIDVHTVRIYAIDILQKDRSNESVILNETLLILRDLTNWFKMDLNNPLNILNQPRATPVNNFLVDYTVGWYIDIDIEADADTNDCVIPFSENFLLTGVTCDMTYINQYLTCATIDECPSFIALEARVTALENASGTTGFDVFVTGGTYNEGTGVATFTNNTGGTFTVSGFSTGGTNSNDVYVTGGTYSNLTGIATFTNTTGGTFNVNGFITGSTFTGNTSGDCITDIFVTNVNSCSPLHIQPINSGDVYISESGGQVGIGTINPTATLDVNGTIKGLVISATTYLNLPTDIYVTGGTYSNTTGIATLRNNTGGTFNVSGFFKPADDIYVTGLTINNATYDLTVTRNDGTSYTANLGILSSDVTITGGTYNNNTGVVTFTNNTGGTFSVSGFITGLTDTRISSFSYNNANTFSIIDSTGGTFTASINVLTGLTVNGSISATTYLNLPTDVFVTGGTYSNGTTTLINNTGGTFNITGYFTGSTDVFVTGGTYSNLTGIATFRNNTGGTFNVSGFNTGSTVGTDVFVTGGTYSNLTGAATFTNNTGGTFNVTGFSTGGTGTDTYVTGFTYSNNVLTIKQNQSQPDLPVLINTMTGLTVNGIISGTTISGGTFYGSGIGLTNVVSSQNAYYGPGSDGNLTLTAGTNLTRAMYYDTLTIASGANFRTSGYQVFAKTAIINDGTITCQFAPGNGFNASNQIGGNGGNIPTANDAFYGSAQSGGSGATGTNSLGSTGEKLIGVNTLGGTAGAGGAGGAGGSGAGGNTTNNFPTVVSPIYTINTGSFLAGITLIKGGEGGAGGASGSGGGGAVLGGGGGGGGAGGGAVYLASPSINNANGTIVAVGGNGGAGGSATGAGNAGGGGGGGGGAGGFIYLLYNSLTGGTFNISGGTAGAGGAKVGTGVSGSTGTNGTAGKVIQVNLTTQNVIIV